MAKIYVNLGEIRNANRRVPDMISRLGSVKRAIGLVRQKVPAEIAGRYDIKRRLDRAYKELCEIEKKMDEIYTVTKSCVEQYEYTEQVNSNNIKAFE